ncbi:hypothetical protein AVEN_652-1 [Araneus ventricosus]|uniref:Uncharacterized protein n=1 Tax=Araneus ventricosus TaxID=182803 RepID=A0A4Y2BTY3_ARAVE|nr:hypothetical protein AVEN_652-1 [Araneus ventricosus]
MQLQAEYRSNGNPSTKLEIILQLQEMLREHNPYIRTFKSAVENIHSTEYQIIIDSDKRPSSEDARRFNLSECNEVAVLIAGEEHGKRHERFRLSSSDL